MSNRWRPLLRLAASARLVVQEIQKETPRFSAFSARQIHLSCPTGSSKKKEVMPSEILDPANTLKVVKLSENAYTPTRGSKHAAGFDLYSAYDYVVPAQGKALVLTDLQVEVPEGCYGRVAPRSGLAVKHFIDVGAGVVDKDYRGNVGVVVFNFGQEDFKVSKGDRIAQFICERILYPELSVQESLETTERGSGGFGSTGKQ